jgi:hypothetical protein
MKAARKVAARTTRQTPAYVSREFTAWLVRHRRGLWRASLVARSRGLRREPIVATNGRFRNLDRRVRIVSTLRRLAALDAIERNVALVTHGLALVGAANMALVLCQWGIGPEHLELIQAAFEILGKLDDAILSGSDAKQLDPMVAPRGQVLLSADERALVRDMVLIHHDQLCHPACTRVLLVRADLEVRRRAAAETERRQMLDAPADLSAVSPQITQALRQVRELSHCEDSPRLSMAVATLETWFAVALEAMQRLPARVVRECAEKVSERAAQAAAEPQGVPA